MSDNVNDAALTRTLDTIERFSGGQVSVTVCKANDQFRGHAIAEFACDAATTGLGIKQKLYRDHLVNVEIDDMRLATWNQLPFGDNQMVASVIHDEANPTVVLTLVILVPRAVLFHGRKWANPERMCGIAPSENGLPSVA